MIEGNDEEKSGNGPDEHTGESATRAAFAGEEPQARPQVERLKMTPWFDPGELLRTGVRTLISTIFGRHSDYRLIEALATGPEGEDFYDHTCEYKLSETGEYVSVKDRPRNPKEAIWIDYVADTGDGWNSTYTIAYHLAQPSLKLKLPGLKDEYETLRGEVLVFGGDQVYPDPANRGYANRLVYPYKTALPHTEAPHPHLYAIPGNHDWYDSLVAFTRLFCQGRWLGGWRTEQRRSYFALKLPHGWWLLGTDVQLGGDIDLPQLEYFKRVAACVGDEDRIILCNAEPHWIFSKIYKGYDAGINNESNLAFLERKVLRKNISVALSGDLHHYRRHAREDDSQKITAGGGGASLFPTHGPDVTELEGGFKLKACYPDMATSRKLCRRNLLFPLINKKFGIATGIFYLLTVWAVRAPIGETTAFGEALSITLATVLDRPFAGFWGLAMVAGFILFTDTHSKWYKLIAGSIHGLVHVLATFLIGWGAAYLTVSEMGLDSKPVLELALLAALVFAGGYLAGPLIMGIYLLVSLNLFKRHSIEAFSSLRIEDWKNFLRLKIEPDGTLTIYPVGIRRVARRWKDRAGGGAGPEVLPDDDEATAPELIEPPIVLKRTDGRPQKRSYIFSTDSPVQADMKT
ncbi:MAG: metallophosphoesterase [Blastocatellia bacterium]|nr:metallophosphoesterase [Blastocatellia bacterium]